MSDTRMMTETVVEKIMFKVSNVFIGLAVSYLCFVGWLLVVELIFH